MSFFLLGNQIIIMRYKEFIQGPTGLDVGRRDTTQFFGFHCSTLLENHGPSLDVFQEPVCDQPKAEDEQEKKKKSKAEHWKECVEYINSIPHLRAVEAKDLKYHCTICTNTNKPKGKINSLGENPTLGIVAHFIKEHLETGQHMSNVQRIVDEQNHEDFGQVACPGYNVSDPSSPGKLCHYRAEFLMWINHAPMEAKACHQYTLSRTDGDMFIRHKECSKSMPAEDGRLCCDLCAALGEPRAVQRQVVHFLRQFYSAHLLSRKLFTTPEETAEFIKSVDNSVFGIQHEYMWQKQKELPLPALQNYVRDSYQSYPDHLCTEPMKLFIGSVARPCLKVNVTSIDEGMARVSASFVNALANRELNDAWLFVQCLKLISKKFACLKWIHRCAWHGSQK